MSNEVSIAMNADTLAALANSGFSLYGFKATGTSNLAGRPLLWLCLNNYAATTIVSWTNQYEAYISNSPIVSNTEVVVGTAASITVGETLQVGAGGSVAVLSEGPPAGISIYNSTDAPLTCGLSENQSGTYTPFSAFPLSGNTVDVITPLERVLFMFSTASVPIGTVIDQSFTFAGPGAYTAGILIDVNEDGQRSVSFDINEGWSWGAFNWGQQIPTISNLLPVLINVDAPLSLFSKGITPNSQRISRPRKEFKIH